MLSEDAQRVAAVDTTAGVQDAREQALTRDGGSTASDTPESEIGVSGGTRPPPATATARSEVVLLGEVAIAIARLIAPRAEIIPGGIAPDYDERVAEALRRVLTVARSRLSGPEESAEEWLSRMLGTVPASFTPRDYAAATVAAFSRDPCRIIENIEALYAWAASPPTGGWHWEAKLDALLAAGAMAFPVILDDDTIAEPPPPGFNVPPRERRSRNGTLVHREIQAHYVWDHLDSLTMCEGWLYVGPQHWAKLKDVKRWFPQLANIAAALKDAAPNLRLTERFRTKRPDILGTGLRVGPDGTLIDLPEQRVLYEIKPNNGVEIRKGQAYLSMLLSSPRLGQLGFRGGGSLAGDWRPWHVYPVPPDKVSYVRLEELPPNGLITHSTYEVGRPVLIAVLSSAAAAASMKLGKKLRDREGSAQGDPAAAFDTASAVVVGVAIALLLLVIWVASGGLSLVLMLEGLAELLAACGVALEQRATDIAF